MNLQNDFAVQIYEMAGIVGEITLALNKLHDWMEPEHVSKNMMTMMDTVYIHRQPLGVVLIIGAWNYPLALVLQPLVGAIAAGMFPFISSPVTLPSMRSEASSLSCPGFQS